MGSTSIQQPTPPPAPTVGQSAADYASSLGTIYNTQLQYSPLFQQQNLDQLQQYAPQYKAIQDALYPELSGLQTQLAKQATAGATGMVPDAIKSQYQDQLRAEVGDQNGSGIAGDYVSRGLVNQQQQYNQYYTNLGLSLSGEQPLYQSSPGGYQTAYSPSQGYNYGSTSQFEGNAYGHYSSAYSSMYGANAQLAGQQYSSNMNMIGGAIGGAAGGYGSYLGSAKIAGAMAGF